MRCPTSSHVACMTFLPAWRIRVKCNKEHRLLENRNLRFEI
jgi:hypothetical protein